MAKEFQKEIIAPVDFLKILGSKMSLMFPKLLERRQSKMVDERSFISSFLSTPCFSASAIDSAIASILD
jgi:hypothetical protein